MSKLKCPCGNVMAVNTMEEDFLYDLIPLKNLSEILSAWDEIRNDSYADKLTELYNKAAKEVYKCPSCGRILVASDKDPNVFDSYIKED
ncbi:hypothetical protein RHO14_07180 [Orbus wheelerorum]|uniref:hypothetical protein n=1 Tax=Orbus wheelerorum TaxID=3074111 RepID=UPI00370DCF51